MELMPRKKKSWNPNGPDYKTQPLSPKGTIEVPGGPVKVGPITAEDRIVIGGHQVYLQKGVRDRLSLMESSTAVTTSLESWQVVGYRSDNGILREVFGDNKLLTMALAWQIVARLLEARPPELFTRDAQIIVYFQGEDQTEYFLINADIAHGLSVLTMTTTQLRIHNKHTRVVRQQ